MKRIHVCMLVIWGVLFFAVGAFADEASKVSSPGVMNNATSKFLGTGEALKKVAINLMDMQALFGGREIAIYGDGATNVKVIYRGSNANKSGTYKMVLSQSEMDQLFAIIIKNDFLTIKMKDRPGVPDEAHPNIILKNLEGKEFSLGKWANDKNERFDAIYNTLLDIENIAVKGKKLPEPKPPVQPK